MKTKKRPLFSVLTNSNFRILWGNQIIMQFAIGTLNFSIVLLLRALTSSNTIISVFVVSVILPTVIFALFAGVLSDLMDRRRMILLSEFLLLLPVIAYSIFDKNVILILLNSFVFNSIAQFFIPAERAIIPMLVAKNELLAANSLFNFTLYGMQFLGFSLAGLLVLKFGYDGLFLFVAGCLLIALNLVRLLPRLKAGDQKFNQLKAVKRDIIARIKECGVFIFSSKRVIGALVILSVLQGIAGILTALSTGYLEEVLKIKATEGSFLLVLPLGLGIVISSLLIGNFGVIFAKKRLVTFGGCISGLTIILLGVLPLIVSQIGGGSLLVGPARSISHIATLQLTPFVTLLWFILGFSVPMVLVPTQTLIHEIVPFYIQGRIFSILSIIVAFMSLPQILISATLADVFGIEKIFLYIGAVVLVGDLILMFFS